MSIDTDDFKVPVGKAVHLNDYDSYWIPKWSQKQEEEEGKKAAKEQGQKLLESNTRKLVELQELFWASRTYSILIILQGMDAAGKDGTISHVMFGVNPQGCQVTSFRTPSTEELDHDFLWRHTRVLPQRGSIGIFNRSYYEDVLIVKVRPEILEKQKLPNEKNIKLFWSQRYEDINMFEQHLVRNGTIILKFFLNVSKKEQKQRLLERLDNPNKEWKFSLADLSERSKWSDYMKAYEDMLNKTTTEWAPWYIIPADKKWVSHASVSEIIISQIKKLDLKYPVLSKEESAALEKAKVELEKE
jgi:PPK2 family polyphosphate:nucleotide phosphotransferase